MLQRVKIDLGRPLPARLLEKQLILMMAVWIQSPFASVGTKILMMHATGVGQQKLTSWFETRNRAARGSQPAEPSDFNNWRSRKIWRAYGDDPDEYVAGIENGKYDIETGTILCGCAKERLKLKEEDDTGHHNENMISYTGTIRGSPRMLQFVNIGVEVAPGAELDPQTLPPNFPDCTDAEVEMVNEFLRKVAKLQRLSKWARQHRLQNACPEKRSPMQPLPVKPPVSADGIPKPRTRLPDSPIRKEPVRTQIPDSGVRQLRNGSTKVSTPKEANGFEANKATTAPAIKVESGSKNNSDLPNDQNSEHLTIESVANALHKRVRRTRSSTNSEAEGAKRQKI
jgi:hypothetical protein